MKHTMRNLRVLINEMKSQRFSFIDGMTKREEEDTTLLNNFLDRIIESTLVMYGAKEVLGHKLSPRTRNACMQYMMRLNEIIEPESPKNLRPANWFEDEAKKLTRYHLRIVWEDRRFIRGLGDVGINEVKKALGV